MSELKGFFPSAHGSGGCVSKHEVLKPESESQPTKNTEADAARKDAEKANEPLTRPVPRTIFPYVV